MFAELKCKTNFSFLTGASQPDEIVQRASEIGLSAIAITDINGVYGMPKAYWAIKNLPSIKLIVGSELRIESHPNITVLARDRAAYGLMCQILTQSHADKVKGAAILKLEELAEFMNHAQAKGLVCIPNEKSNYDILKELFINRLFVPVSRFKDGHDIERVQYALDIARQFDLPIIATNDVLYHNKDRKKLCDAFTCIRETTSLTKAGFKLLPNAERFLKSPFEMKLLFKDLPIAISNTMRVAESCVFSPSELRYRYPSEWIPAEETAQTFLEKETYKGAHERYKGEIPLAVQKQLVHEFKLIKELGFADYFLTIYDIVNFARSQDILCQGRGSAANSSVCYCLGITAIDPVKMNLLFERFISPERNEPPDIDVDFEHERREEVIQYIYKKYGRDRAGMVSAVVTYQRRSAFRELSKAFDIDVGTLSSKKLLKDFEKYEKQSPIPDCRAKIEALAEEMTGFPRHISIHSGGFTLSADPITQIVPVEPARMKGRTIVQWDKYDLDYLGLLKVDVLALGMLSALKKNLDLVGMKLYEVPVEDKETYQMIQRADTVGTFQVESRAQMNMSGRLIPREFYDLVVQVAIVRPGPIVGNMVHPYLKRRRGEKVEYPHPKLKEILGRTLGVPLFQEQLMKIAIELGNFTPGEADKLRRAIGAWRASGSIQKISERLLAGLRKNGIPDAYSHIILEQMKGFAHYGFPESHAASFALLAYASCYLKCHHPAEFACSLINSQPMGFYASHTIIDDAKRHGVRFLPINPNNSDWHSTMENGAVRLGLNSTKGLSKIDAGRIIQNRPYANLSDFLSRTTLRQDVLHRMAMGDAFVQFGEDQRHTLWRILNEQVIESQEQLDFFSGAEGSDNSRLFNDVSAFESVKFDYAAYRVSVRAHPMEVLRKIKPLPKFTSFDAKRAPPKTFIKTSGLLLVRQKPPTANGVCFAAIEDEFGFLDMVLFKDSYDRNKDVFLHHCFIIVGGYIERDGNSISMIVKSVEPIWKDEVKETNGLVIEPTQYFW